MKKNFLKLFMLAFMLFTFISTVALAKVSVLYINKDHSSHILEIVCQENKAQVTVEGQSSGTKTLPGSGPCVVSLGEKQLRIQGKEQVVIRKGKIYLQ